MNDQNDDHAGYGKPPKHSQFKKGQSGNPKGRPKGTFNAPTAVEQALTKKVTFASPSGKKVRMTVFEAIIQRLVVDALKGRPQSAQLALRLPKDFNIPIEPPPHQIIIERRIVEPDGKMLALSREAIDAANYFPGRKK
jgi:Family of unknown function (DUF5681)